MGDGDKGSEDGGGGGVVVTEGEGSGLGGLTGVLSSFSSFLFKKFKVGTGV